VSPASGVAQDFTLPVTYTVTYTVTAADASTKTYTVTVSAALLTYYVSTTGNDSNDGLTTTTPWSTLEYAAAHATAPGTVIALKRGDTWLLDNALDLNRGGAAGHPIVWDGAVWGTGANAVIQASSDGGPALRWYSLVHIAGCSHLAFQNITVDVHSHRRDGMVVGGDDGTDGATHQNNESDILIQNSSILNCGDGTNYEICLLVATWNTDISNITIRGNHIDGASNHGIAFYPGRIDIGAPAPHYINDSTWATTPSPISGC
jgi:hypothetical protein